MSTTLTGKKWALKSYAKLENNVWKKIKIDKQSSYLILIHPQLIIALDNKGATDTVDLSGEAGEKIEVHYAGAIVVIKITDKNARISKIRMRFAKGNGNKKGSGYCSEVVDELKKFVPVIQHPAHTDGNPEGQGIQPQAHTDGNPEGQGTQLPAHTDGNPEGQGIQLPAHTDGNSEGQPETLETTNNNGETLIQTFLEMTKDGLALLSGTSSGPVSIFSDSEMKELISAFVLHPQFPNTVVEIWEELSKLQ